MVLLTDLGVTQNHPLPAGLGLTLVLKFSTSLKLTHWSPGSHQVHSGPWLCAQQCPPRRRSVEAGGRAGDEVGAPQTSMLPCQKHTRNRNIPVWENLGNVEIFGLSDLSLRINLWWQAWVGICLARVCCAWHPHSETMGVGSHAPYSTQGGYGVSSS